MITSLSWDYEDRLIGITYPNSSTNTFGYNGFGARISKSDSTGNYTFFRNGTGVTAPVLSDSYAEYTLGISEKRSENPTYYHSDIKNTTSQTNSSQNVSGTNTYDAFGNLIDYDGTWNGPFTYGGAFGYQTDDDSGLMLLGHRYYDSSTGRFLSRDPIGDGSNWYSYCGNNPLSFADVDGLKKVVIVVGAGISPEPLIPNIDFALAKALQKIYEMLGWTVILLLAPTESDLEGALGDADGLIFIGHGNDRWGRLRGRGRGLGATSEKLTPSLIENAFKKAGRKNKLDFLILIACDMCKDPAIRDAYLRLTRVLRGYTGHITIPQAAADLATGSIPTWFSRDNKPVIRAPSGLRPDRKHDVY